MAKKPKTEEKQGTLTVTKTILGQSKEKVEKLEVNPFVTDTATVSVKMGATISMGNYSSARIDVMIAVPCYCEEIPEMYKKVRNSVEKLIEREVKKIEQDS